MKMYEKKRFSIRLNEVACKRTLAQWRDQRFFFAAMASRRAVILVRRGAHSLSRRAPAIQQSCELDVVFNHDCGSAELPVLQRSLSLYCRLWFASDRAFRYFADPSVVAAFFFRKLLLYFTAFTLRAKSGPIAVRLTLFLVLLSKIRNSPQLNPEWRASLAVSHWGRRIIRLLVAL